jgi:CRISPR-associated endonuclease/helicase Cas3
LKPDQFAEFFAAVHGKTGEDRQPFDWQKRLAAQVLDTGDWPDVIRVPTGCGKTSVLDLAVFELALQASKQAPSRTAAWRICFVIDRRIVVDEVTDHAREIQTAIRDPDGLPVVKAVADQLRRLAPNNGEPLRLVRLRGGVYRDDGWAADPLTPTIIISTIDQIGSRLLFRGYGVSRRNLPVHAGLLAFDTRVILDEAHLSSVFGETLGAVRRYQRVAEASPLPDERRISLVCMSATARGGGSSFDLSSEDRNDERLKPRIEASKSADLVVVQVEAVAKDLRKKQPAKAREQEMRNRQAVVTELVNRAKACAAVDGETTDRPRVIGVIVNRVATARQVFDKLSSEDDHRRERETLLLTGRIRPFDRDWLLEAWLPRIRAGRKQEPDKPVFVVATQTVEVGANIDFDALVTEAASLDALRQRFGRLDRLGNRYARNLPVKATIVIRKDQAKTSDDDPVYGSAMAATWKWLNSVATTTGKGASKRASIDFGVNAMDARVPADTEALRPMLAPKPETPVLFPTHLDSWVRTNPLPDPDPDVSPFLHGRAETPADVQVVWRADLDPERRSSWLDIVSLVPPLSREALPVPIYELRAWLKNMAEANVSDVEGAQPEADDRVVADGALGYVLRWRGRDDARVVGPDDVKPGDTVVVPARYGGADAFGWCPRWQGPVEDIADRCLAQLVASYPATAFRRPKLRLRLHPALFPPADDGTRERLDALLRRAASAARTEDQDAWSPIARLLRAIEAVLPADHLNAAVKALLHHGGRVVPYPEDEGVVIAASIPLAVERPLPEDETEHEEPEGDEASFTGRQVPLIEHLESVARSAGVFARGCGLDDVIVKALELAGSWHDQGKHDHRFQAWLRGSELQALAADQPIAKSGRDVGQWKPSTLFGYPRGTRHEFTSVRLFEQAGNRRREADHDHDLAKLLIGTHHGFGRPFVPVVMDRQPVEVRLRHDGADLVTSSDHGLHRLDSGWTDLFWSMVRRFGWWGLAFLEALLVTADRTVSAREQQVQQSAPEDVA